MIFIVPADHFWRYVKILRPKGAKCGDAFFDLKVLSLRVWLRNRSVALQSILNLTTTNIMTIT